MFYNKYQTGSGLIEQLVAMFVLAIGVTGAMSMQAVAINQAGDSQYRTEASILANQIIDTMWTDSATLSAYQHNPTGSTCAPTAAASTNANVVAWLSSFTTASGATYLPGATDATQQISVDSDRIVQVTVCWKPPHDDGWHNLTVTSQIPLSA